MTAEPQEYSAIPVRLHPDDLDALIRGQGKIRKRRALRTNSYTLTAASPTQLAMPQANNRVEGWITSAVSTGATSEQTPASPAAGADFIYTNNTGEPQTVQALKFVFTASAAVANRFLNVQIKDAAGNLIAQIANGSAVVANTSTTVSLFQGYTTAWNAASGTGTGTLPSTASIPAGGTLTIHVVGIDVADQISAVVLTLAGPAPVVFISGSQAGANAQAGGASQVNGLDTTPFPVSTTDQVWISAAAGLPVVVSTMAIYEEDE